MNNNNQYKYPNNSNYQHQRKRKKWDDDSPSGAHFSHDQKAQDDGVARVDAAIAAAAKINAMLTGKSLDQSFVREKSADQETEPPSAKKHSRDSSFSPRRSNSATFDHESRVNGSQGIAVGRSGSEYRRERSLSPPPPPPPARVGSSSNMIPLGSGRSSASSSSHHLPAHPPNQPPPPPDALLPPPPSEPAHNQPPASDYIRDWKDRRQYQPPPPVVPTLDPEEFDYDGSHYIKRVPLNSIRNRYLVTKTETQKQLQDEYGVKIDIVGKYYPDEKLATEREPAIHLRISGAEKSQITKTVDRVMEILKQQVVLLDQPEPPKKKTWPECKVVVGIDVGSNSYQLRGKLIGAAGANVKHIQKETGAKVQLKGIGSGYMEPDTGKESDEPLYVFLACPTQEGLDKARELCESLIATVKADFERSKHAAAYSLYAPYMQQYGAAAPMPGGYAQPPPPPPSGMYGMPGAYGSDPAMYQPPPPPPSGDAASSDTATPIQTQQPQYPDYSAAYPGSQHPSQTGDSQQPNTDQQQSYDAYAAYYASYGYGYQQYYGYGSASNGDLSAATGYNSNAQPPPPPPSSQ